MSEELRSELKVIQYYFNKRVDTLEVNIKDDFDSIRKDISEIKDFIDKHLGYCDTLMDKHETRVKKLEEFKNRALGAVGIVVFIITVLVAVWAGSR